MLHEYKILPGVVSDVCTDMVVFIIIVYHTTPE